MMKRTTLQVLLLCTMANAYAQLSPEVTSWLVNANGASWHDILETNVEQVQYTDNDVYISCKAIPGYDIGPWEDPSLVPNQNFVFKITRHPQLNSSNPFMLEKGRSGIWANGVSMFSCKTGVSYRGQDIWHTNGALQEDPASINCDGTASEIGEYYNYVAPTCLFDGAASKVHSPILGYAFDGYPVYGPYAFANTDGSGEIVRMISSYQIREITERTTLPDGTLLNTDLSGPKVSNTYPIGFYMEDYAFIEGSGSLDKHNGRFCITPEYPEGTYAYFVTVDQTGNPAYPYTIADSYVGMVPDGNLGEFSGHNEITESVVTYSSIGNVQNQIDMMLYPNPAQEYVYVYIAPSFENNITATITDMSGKVVMVQQNLQPGIAYEFYMQNVMQGLYLLKLENENVSAFQKFVISRK